MSFSFFFVGRKLLARQNLRVHPDDEHLFVVGPVVDPDPAALGERLHRAPEIVVVALLRRWRLEAEHLAALRVDAAHDVADRAVLAGRVHRLEDEEQRVGVLRVQPILLARELPDAVLEEHFRLGFVPDVRGPVGIVVVERDLRARRRLEPLHHLSDSLHGSSRRSSRRSVYAMRVTAISPSPRRGSLQERADPGGRATASLPG